MAVIIEDLYVAKSHAYRGEIHSHLDGSSAYDVMESYKAINYDFASVTEKDAMTPDPLVPGILYIPGVEEICDPTDHSHWNQIGAVSEKPSKDAQTVIDACVADEAFMQYNHPAYEEPFVDFISDILPNIENYHAIEVVNVGTSENNEAIWDQALTLGHRIWGTATDDHADPSASTGGSVVVFADALTQNEIVNGLKSGNFYASVGGVTMSQPTLSGYSISVTTPDPATISFIGKDGLVFKKVTGATSASYFVSGSEQYIRIKVSVSATQYALSNPFPITNTGGALTTKKVQNNPYPHLSFGYLGSPKQVTVTSAPNLFAWSFVAPANPFGGALNLSELRWYCGAVSGPAKAQLFVYSDNAGLPGSPIANGTGIESGVLTVGYVDSIWVGTLPAVTPGTQYWIIWKLTAGTSYRIDCVSGINRITSSIYGSGSAGSGIGFDHCTASGVDGVWAGSSSTQTIGFRIKYTDGTDITYEGLGMIESGVVHSSAGYRADGTDEVGFKITVPSNVRLRVAGILYNIGKTGTPGDLRFKVYEGPSSTLIETSFAIPVANINPADNTAYLFNFTKILTLEPGTTYKFALSAVSGDASNYYFAYVSTIDPTAIPLELVPWSTLEIRFTGGAWVDDERFLPALSLVVDTETPFGSIGGGLMINPGLSGGLR